MKSFIGLFYDEVKHKGVKVVIQEIDDDDVISALIEKHRRGYSGLLEIEPSEMEFIKKLSAAELEKFRNIIGQLAYKALNDGRLMA
ncbi:MAG: hypothetical protein WC621_03755 [Patescibacteria group bacterium]